LEPILNARTTVAALVRTRTNMDVAAAQAGANTGRDKALALSEESDPRDDSCRRTPDEIHTDLRVRLAKKALLPCAVQSTLVFSTYDNKRLAMDGVRAWIARNAKVCGTGNFAVRCNSLQVPRRRSGKTHGARGRIECSKPGCGWHLWYEEAKGRNVVFLDADLTHDLTVPHLSPDASDVEVAAQAGSKWIPSDLSEEVIWWHSTGQRPRDCLKMLNQKAKDRLIPKPFPWDYDTVFNMVRFHGCLRYDASNFLAWLDERRERLGLRYRFKTDENNRLKRVYWELESAFPWRERGFDLVYFDTTHGTTGYDMKLGCFTSVDGEGKTVVLAASLLANEDTPSFAWVFDEFTENMQRDEEAEDWAPRAIFTDSDAAMAAAAREVWGDRTVHLLCIFHLELNLKEHAKQLFPNKADDAARGRFMKLFRAIMKEYGSVEDRKLFDKRWAELLLLVHQTTPCPWGLPDLSPPEAGDEDEDSDSDSDSDSGSVDPAAGILQSVLGSARRGIEALSRAWSALAPKDDDEEEAVKELEVAKSNPVKAELMALERALKPIKRQANKKFAENGWRWLDKMYRKREQWARCYVLSHFTAASFTTQRAESWHAQLKEWLKSTHQMTALGKQLVECSNDKVFGDAVAAQRKRTRLTSDGVKDPLLADIMPKVTTYAWERLQDVTVASLNCTVGDEPIDYGRKDDEDGYETDESLWHVEDFDSETVDVNGETVPSQKYVVSIKRCSCQLPVNTGLPCMHQMAMARAGQHRPDTTSCIKRIPLEWVHPMWLIPSQEEIEAYAKLRKAHEKSKGLPSQRQDRAVPLHDREEREHKMAQVTREALNLGKNNPALFERLLEIQTRATEEMRTLVRQSQAQKKRKRGRAATAPEVEVEATTGGEVGDGEGEEEDDVEELVSNPVVNASGSGRKKTRRIQNTGLAPRKSTRSRKGKGKG
jgi:hypothetical protein